MRLGPALGVVLAALVGCRPAARPAHAAQNPAGSSIAIDPSAAVRAVCDSVAALWRGTGRAKVRVADTTMRVASDSVAQRGCAVVATAPEGLDSAQRATLYWTTSQSRGWAELIDYTADGPDGGSQTVARQGIRCQIDFTQDGGDDSDSTYVPSPATAETNFCWAYS